MANTASFEVLEPFFRAWARTRKLLFEPFRFEHWAIFGFSSWLAMWAGSGGGVSLRWVLPPDKAPELFTDGREQLSHWVFGAALATLVVIGTVGLAWAILRIWLQSRFDFIFLRHLITGETRIAQPWGEFRELGHSLFRWRLILVIGWLALLMLPVGLAVGAGFRPSVVSVGALILGALLLVPLALVGPFLFFAIDQFVVPIMARQRLPFVPAMVRLRELVSAHPVPFLLYLLLYLALAIATGIAAMAIGFATCCVGFLLIALPYVGSVVLLPIGVLSRYFGLEFLRQFGPDFDLLAPEETPLDSLPPQPG